MSRKRNIIIEDVSVIDTGAKGKSVAKAPDGHVVFVANTVPGDVVDMQTTKKKFAYYEGFAVKSHQLSAERITLVYSHSGYYGGCKWQDLAYERQLYYRQKKAENNLVRLGRITIPQPVPIIGSGGIYFYRNRMGLSFSGMRWSTPEGIKRADEITNRNELGFHIVGAWDRVLDTKKCYLQAVPSNAIRLEIKRLALESRMSFYSPHMQRGLLYSMIIRLSSTDELMVMIRFFSEDKEIELLLTHLANHFSKITLLQYCINSKGGNALYDQDIICYKGQDCIYEEIEDLRFKINVKSFYQTNSKQAQRLYGVAHDSADLKGDKLVYDLYTDTGTITQFIAKRTKRVVGVEVVSEATADARANAVANGIDNASFYVGDMKSVFSEAFIAANGVSDIIITDPPRDGMHKDVIAQILHIVPAKVVYVSCSNTTQARGLALIDEQYKATKVQPADMSPWTYHVENVVLLEKR